MNTEALRKPRLILFATLALAAFLGGIQIARLFQGGEPAPAIDGLLWPNPPAIGEFSLRDANGGNVDPAHLRGHWTLLFFGFTHCPDVCPTTLATLKQVKSQLADLAAFANHGQILFVSVDPARDDPATLKQYTAYFDPAIIAATAPPEQLTELTRQLGVIYAKVETADPATYTMDHTASILLIDPNLRLIGVFSPPHEAAGVAQRVRAIIAFLEPRL